MASISQTPSLTSEETGPKKGASLCILKTAIGNGLERLLTMGHLLGVGVG